MITTPNINRSFQEHYNLFILVFIAVCQMFRFYFQTEFNVINLDAGFMNLRQISCYRNHFKISTKVLKSYCDRYLYLSTVVHVTGTFRSNTDVDEIMGKGTIPLFYSIYAFNIQVKFHLLHFQPLFCRWLKFLKQVRVRGVGSNPKHLYTLYETHFLALSYSQ